MTRIKNPNHTMNQDGYVNAMNSFGTSRDSSMGYRWEPEAGTQDVLLTQNYEGNGIFAKIIDRPAEECFKQGYDFEGLSDDEIKKKVLRVLDYIDFDESYIMALKWARLYGGALVVMLIDDGSESLEEPLNYDAIRSIDELRVFERSIVTPDYESMYNHSAEPDQPWHRRSNFGMPEFYTVNSIFGVFRVHESRCLVVRNGRLPERASQMIYRFWGMPEYARIQKEMQEAATTASYSVKLLERASQAVYAMQGLSELLTTEEGEEKLMKRMDALDLARGLLNSIVIEKEGESYDFKSAALTGVQEIIDSTCNMLSAVTNIPQTVLFGRSPAGMNATGDSDMENYYSFIGRMQTTMLRRNFEKLCDIIFIAMLNRGKISEIPEHEIVFNPLKTVSEQEQATIDQQKASTQQVRAQTEQTYMDAGVLDPSEVRTKLAKEGEYDVETTLDDLPEGDLLEMPEGGGEDEPTEQESKQNSLQSSADSGILNTDRKGWNTAENGEHFLVGEEGNIEGGFGGKFNGKEPGTAFEKKNPKAMQGGATPKAQNTAPKQPPAPAPAPKGQKEQAASQEQAEPEPDTPHTTSDEPFDIAKVPKKDINQIEKGNTRYVGSFDSTYINQAFWTGNEQELSKDRKKVVEALDRNMKPIGQAASVYRYIDDEDPLFQAKPGQSVTNKGYSSTTSGDHAFNHRAGKVEIRVPSTGKVYIPQNRSENETIIHRDATFKIISRKVKNGKVDIVAELVE